MTATRATPNGTAPSEAPSLEKLLARVAAMDDDGHDLRPLTEALLREKFTLEGALAEVRQKQQALRAELHALTRPQLYPAVITEVLHDPGRSVEVHSSGQT